MELFAWALLRFPEAPEALRRGLLLTLHEEQNHCELYLSRLRALGAPQGAPLGAEPLSSHLWRSLAAIRAAEQPLLSFLCGVGLTFEQANLDHTRRFQQLFRQVKDHETASVLQRIHVEEQRHVRFAARWLRRLGKGTELELYQRHAVPPTFHLSKAKGKGFQEAARRAAGLSEAFIEATKSARSCRQPLEKGRRPHCTYTKKIFTRYRVDIEYIYMILQYIELMLYMILRYKDL